MKLQQTCYFFLRRILKIKSISPRKNKFCPRSKKPDLVVPWSGQTLWFVIQRDLAVDQKVSLLPESTVIWHSKPSFPQWHWFVATWLTTSNGSRTSIPWRAQRKLDQCLTMHMSSRALNTPLCMPNSTVVTQSYYLAISLQIEEGTRGVASHYQSHSSSSSSSSFLIFMNQPGFFFLLIHAQFSN